MAIRAVLTKHQQILPEGPHLADRQQPKPRPDGASVAKQRCLPRPTRLGEETVKEAIMADLIQAVEAQFPRLLTSVYAVPPVHFNRLTFTSRQVHGVEVKVQKESQQLSDVREDEGLERVFRSLTRLFQAGSAPAVLVSGLTFEDYLKPPAAGPTPRHKAAALAESNSNPSGRKRWACEAEMSLFNRPCDLDPTRQRGEFDVMVVHKEFGVLIIEIKNVGNCPSRDYGSSVNDDDVIAKRIRRALKQMDKGETVMRHLVGDLHPNLPVRHVLALPNMTRARLMQILKGDAHLEEEFSGSFKSDLASAVGMCLCWDHLPPEEKPRDEATSDVTKMEIRDWWQNVKACGGISMSDRLYKSLIARLYSCTYV